MLDRTTAPVASALSVHAPLTGRRTLYCALVGATTIGLLWLALCDHAAMVGDRLLERLYRIRHHARRPRSGRRR
jgi:putative copper export protein